MGFVARMRTWVLLWYSRRCDDHWAVVLLAGAMFPGLEEHSRYGGLPIRA